MFVGQQAAGVLIVRIRKEKYIFGSGLCLTIMVKKPLN